MEENKDNVYNDYVKLSQENSDDNIYDSLLQSDEEEIKGKFRK